MIFFRRSFTGRESYVKAPFQMLFIQRTQRRDLTPVLRRPVEPGG